jgi:hypothetical protein
MLNFKIYVPLPLGEHAEQCTVGRRPRNATVWLVIEEIEQQLSNTNNCRQIALDVLHQVDDWDACFRRPHYEDVFNILWKKCHLVYRRNNDHHQSFDMWLRLLDFYWEPSRVRCFFWLICQSISITFSTTTTRSRQVLLLGCHLQRTVIRDKETIMYTLVAIQQQTGFGNPITYTVCWRMTKVLAHLSNG